MCGVDLIDEEYDEDFQIPTLMIIEDDGDDEDDNDDIPASTNDVDVSTPPASSSQPFSPSPSHCHALDDNGRLVFVEPLVPVPPKPLNVKPCKDDLNTFEATSSETKAATKAQFEDMLLQSRENFRERQRKMFLEIKKQGEKDREVARGELSNSSEKAEEKDGWSKMVADYKDYKRRVEERLELKKNAAIQNAAIQNVKRTRSGHRY